MKASHVHQPFVGLQPLEERLLLSGELAAYQVVVADLSGNPVTSVEVGQDFQLIVSTQDLRGTPAGVFAGYLDVAFDGLKVHPTGSFSYGDNYANGHQGSTSTDGLLDEVGAFAGLSPLGGGVEQLFSIQFHADAAGTVVFAGDPADISPMHDTLEYGLDTPLLASQILYGSATLQVNPAAPPTADLANPANGEDVLASAINGGGYIDVTYSDTGGSGLNLATITDAGQEFTLSGAAAAGVTVNGAATLVSGTTYRYTFTGSFLPGPVTITYAAGGFADNAGNTNGDATQGFTVTSADSTPPTADLADPTNGGSIRDLTINGRGYIDVTYSDMGGSGLNPATITDAGQEFTLSGAAAAGVTVNGAATLVSGTTYRYACTGSFGLGPVTVDFAAGSFADNAGNPNGDASEGFTVMHLDVVPPTADLADPTNGGSINDLAVNGRGYIDVTYSDTDGSGLNLATITDAGQEFTLSGAAAAGVTVDGAATLVSGTTYRYTYTGNFTAGAVTVNFEEGSFADNAGNPDSAASEGFTVTHIDIVPPTADLADPTNGESIRDLTINGRGYIDVTYSDTDGSGLNLATITDAGQEFTLGGAAAAGVTVNGAATLVSGTTYRYTCTGSFGLGPVTVDFSAGSFADNAGNPNGAASEGFTVMHLDVVPPTADLADPTNGGSINDLVVNGRGYIDVTYSDTDGSGLNLATITDAGQEFTLSGAAAAGVTVNGAATLVGGTTYRYTYTGNFTAGAVIVNFAQGSFADNAGNPNGAAGEGFTVTHIDIVPPTADLANPTNGAVVLMSTINARGYIDVTYSDTDGSGLNLATITDAGQEFTLDGAAAANVTVNGAAALVSGTTYRYTFTGSFVSGTVNVNFIAGSFADNAGNPNAPASESFTTPNIHAVNDSATVAEDSVNNLIPVLANDTGDPLATLAVTAVGAAGHGTAALVGGQVRYSPAPNFNGIDSFTYTMIDGLGGTDTATVQVTVSPVNDAPTAQSQTASTGENTPLFVMLAGSDLETPLANLTFNVPAAGDHGGTLVAQAHGLYLYTPAYNFNGVEQFTFTVTDTGDPAGGDQGWGYAAPLTSAPATVQINVGCSLSVVSGVPTSFTDADGDTVTVTLMNGGTGLLEFAHGPYAGFFPDMSGIVLDGTTAKSTLDISTKPPATNSTKAASTSIQYLTVHGPLASLTAGTTNVVGDGVHTEVLEFDNSVKTLTLNDISGGHILQIGPRLAGDTTTTASLTANHVADLSVESQTPLNKLTAVEWLDTDGTTDVIDALSAATITITGAKATSKVAFSRGDFQADLHLTGGGTALGTFSAAGNLTDRTWNVTGGIGSVTVLGQTQDTSITCGGLLGTATLKAVSGLSISSGPAPTAAGTTTFKATSVRDTSITSAAPIGTLSVVEWLDTDQTPDVIAAPSIATVNVTGLAATATAAAIRGDFQADLQLSLANNYVTKLTLGSLSVAGWLDGSSTWSAGKIGTVTVGGMKDSLIYAGVTPGSAALPSAIGRLENSLACINNLQIKGIAGAAGPWLIDSKIAAWTLGTIVVRDVDGDNAANGDAALGITAHCLATSYTRYTGTKATVALKTKLGPVVGPLDAVGPDYVVLLV